MLKKKKPSLLVAWVNSEKWISLFGASLVPTPLIQGAVPIGHCFPTGQGSVAGFSLRPHAGCQRCGCLSAAIAGESVHDALISLEFGDLDQCRIQSF